MTRDVGESPTSVTPLDGETHRSSARSGEVGLSVTSGALSPGLPHTDDHDPILGDEWSHEVHGPDYCAACLAARESVFAQLRHIEPGLGPDDTDEFIRRMQEMARSHLRLVMS